MDPLEKGIVMNEQAILLRAMQTELEQSKSSEEKKQKMSQDDGKEL